MILHVDMDAFYASVELRDNPELAGKPVVVGGSPKGRGVIAAASYEARQFGLHSAMPAARAVQVCPSVVFIKPRMEHYVAISKQIREVFLRYTSLVEPLSLDEAFLDVTGCQRLFGDAGTIGQAIKCTIKEELNLVASVGVAPNKYLAKIASDLDKPDGFVVVDPNRIDDFLGPLPISRVWGVGPQTARKLKSMGAETIGQLRNLARQTLDQAFGINGDHFWRLARGLDTRSVVPDRIAKSVSHETTFAVDIADDNALQAWLLELTDQVGMRLRRNKIFGKTIQLKVRYSDFRTITRSRTLPVATQSTQVLCDTAIAMLSAVRSESAGGIRLLGIGVSHLSTNHKKQQGLFDQVEQAESNRIDDASDSIRDRFGINSVRRASSLEHQINFRKQPRLDDLDSDDR